MRNFWVINAIIQAMCLLVLWVIIPQFIVETPNSYKFVLTGLGLTFQSMVALIYLIIVKLKTMSFNITFIGGFILILSSILIVLFGWEDNLQKNVLVGISIIAFSFTLKDALDYVDDIKGSKNKYLGGKVAIIIWGVLSLLIMMVIPMADFVGDVNTDLFTIISLGLVLATIGAKQEFHNATKLVNILNLKGNLRGKVKKLNTEQQVELENVVEEFLLSKNL